MIGNGSLQGKRIAVIATDGFEKIELTVPVKALRAEGAHVDIVSLRLGKIRGLNLHEPAGKVSVDRTVFEAKPQEYDGLFIPGGFINPDLLRQSHEAREFVRAFDTAKKPIAVICHGPWLLASADLLKGRRITSWPGVRDDLVHAGATWLDQEVVWDKNWVSSRSPADLQAFLPAITDLFAGRESTTAEIPQEVQSDPQHNAPPEVLLDVMEMIPKPSLRTAIGVGALAAGVMVATRRRAA